MRATTHKPGRFNFKAWFRIHTWSALISVIILGMLAVTGVLIYPLDQFGLRDIPLQSAWLPAIYETNTWRSLLRSLAVAPDGWLYASHRHGLFVSRDGGRSWQDLTARIPGHFAADEGRFPPLLAMYPYNSNLLVASKGRGLALSRDRGATWELYGDSDDEDLSHSPIQAITYDPLSGVVLVIDANGFGYRRSLDPRDDEGWELFTFKLPYGEQRGVGVMDWYDVALSLHNGQLLSQSSWWMINHGFGLLLFLLALTGCLPWWRRQRHRHRPVSQSRRLVRSKVWRRLHHAGGWLSWPLLVLFPLTGVVLIHAVDVPALLRSGVSRRWLPSRYDQNRWQGPVGLHLRTLAISPNNASRLWVGHTYGLFASEDGGQHWTDVSAAMSSPITKQIEHLVVAPGWLHFLGAGNERGLQLSRDFGGHWRRLLEQPVDALYANNTALYIASGNTLYWQKLHLLASLAPPPWEHTSLAPPYGRHRSRRRTTLYQLLHDLHSGKLLGEWFRYALDLVAGLMLVQSVTGLLLWGMPRWQRWRRRRGRG